MFCFEKLKHSVSCLYLTFSGYYLNPIRLFNNSRPINFHYLTFSDFNLDKGLLEGIAASGYTTPTLVQVQVIPIVMAGKDLIASAQTGTGKTAAFLLPVVHRLIQRRSDTCVNALILVPTRELAVQIEQNLEGLSYFTNIGCLAVYGGNDAMDFTAEKKALSHGVDVAICTPGRLIAHLNMGYVKLKGLQVLILDEADRMLDMGFQADINKIISFLPAKRQTLMFSATMPDKIRTLAKKILKQPEEVNIAICCPPEKIQQEAFVVYENQKLPLMKFLLKSTNYPSTLIFCSRKQTVKQLTRELKQARLQAAEIHSDLEQNEREEVLQQFKSRRLPILVATDILSRGIDVDTIDLVVNYDVPHDGEDYVHRIGRTARAESQGRAITLISEKEQNKFAGIEQLLGKQVNKLKVPKELGPAPEYHPRLRISGGKSSNYRGRPQGRKSFR